MSDSRTKKQLNILIPNGFEGLEDEIEDLLQEWLNYYCDYIDRISNEQISGMGTVKPIGLLNIRDKKK